METLGATGVLLSVCWLKGRKSSGARKCSVICLNLEKEGRLDHLGISGWAGFRGQKLVIYNLTLLPGGQKFGGEKRLGPGETHCVV